MSLPSLTKIFLIKENDTKELFNAAIQAGRKLFGKKLHAPPTSEIKHVKFSDLLKLDPDENYIDEYEYVFFPSSGEGLDVSNESWADATKDWVDSDGNIYTYLDGVITVVDVDEKLNESPFGGGGAEDGDSGDPEMGEVEEEY